MTDRKRFQAVLNGETSDRLPVIEWASWWGETVNRWRAEQPDCPIDKNELYDYFGLDNNHQFWLRMTDGKMPAPAYHGAPIIADSGDFNKNLPHLYTEENLQSMLDGFIKIKNSHDRGDTVVWYTFEGFFWFPRSLLGIENHLYAFYDYPELMHEMNDRLASYYERVIPMIYEIITPEFMTFAEDMSYNHGPMLSRELYDEFMAPYYKRIIPLIQKHGTKVLKDTDGDVEPLIPWFEEVGIEGVLPLERQAGVDVNRIRENHPEWIMIGGYDKTVMHKGEKAMRAEFERLIPAMKSGRYIPSVDHQTPPDVTLENYRIYVKLLKEYTQKI